MLILKPFRRLRNGMIPELPIGVTDSDLLEFYDKLAGNLSDQSTVHIHWWTHRQNPSVCWICDKNLLITKLIALAGKYITKSTVDMETDSSSGNDSDSEIESFENSYNEPEYDVDDELQPEDSI